MFPSHDFSFVHKYFIAEKQAGLVLGIAGIIAIGLAVFFWGAIKNNPAFYRGLALPLAIAGLLQVSVGVSSYTKSEKTKMDVAYKMGMDPGFIKNTEQPRMEKIHRQLAMYKYTMKGMLIAGLVLIILYRSNADRQFWLGLGMMLSIQAAICITFTSIAENRGLAYLTVLQKKTAANK